MLYTLLHRCALALALAVLGTGTAACTGEVPPDLAARARDSAVRVAASSAVAAAAATARRLPQICTDTMESGALRCGNGRVTRRGDTLALALLLSDTAVRVDRRGARGGLALAEYRYMGRIRGANGGPSLHIVEALDPETVGVELVNARTGDSVRVSGFPVPSPDGARFATVPLGRGDCRHEGRLENRLESRLELWRLTEEAPMREWSLVLDDCAGGGSYATALAWRSPDTLAVEREHAPADTARSGRIEHAPRDTLRTLVVRGPRGWAVVAPR